jgi:hypothetical protein
MGFLLFLAVVALGAIAWLLFRIDALKHRFRPSAQQYFALSRTLSGLPKLGRITIRQTIFGPKRTSLYKGRLAPRFVPG